MMPLETYIAYLVACMVIIMVPGPTVTLIIGNSIRHGTRAGLLNVAGTHVGIAMMIAVVGIGLTSMIETMGHWFQWLRLVGAAYLIWLGFNMIRASGQISGGTPTPPRSGFFMQGLLVALSNPKTLIFFGAFLPQFIDRGGNHVLQIAVLGATALVFGVVSDGAYALVAGKARQTLSAHRMKLLSRVSGGFLIGGGLWIALTRAK